MGCLIELLCVCFTGGVWQLWPPDPHLFPEFCVPLFLE